MEGEKKDTKPTFDIIWINGWMSDGIFQNFTENV